MTTAVDKAVKLEEFIAWTKKHIKGDEKGEAQVFLDRMFQAFGWPGLREAGVRLRTCSRPEHRDELNSGPPERLRSSAR